MAPASVDVVRAGNVRVPTAEFLAVWAEARRRAAAASDDDRSADAVAQTCRWLAAAPLRTALCGGQARSPVTDRAWRARPDEIEAEWQAAREPAGFAAELAARPGWADGVRATLRWAWAGEGPPPLVPGDRLAGDERPIGE